MDVKVMYVVELILLKTKDIEGKLFTLLCDTRNDYNSTR